MKSNKSKRQKAIDKLDAIYSKWIRYTAASSQGYCKCVTCGKVGPIKEMQCGHFISRGEQAVRWEPRNTGVQCVACNIFGQGKQYEFSLYLDKTHGKGTADLMLVLSKKVSKIGPFELEAMALHYAEEVEAIKIMKGLQ